MKLDNRAMLTIQGVLLCATAVWGSYRAQSLQAERKLPEMRNEPLSIAPQYDYSIVITDEQLDRVLWKLRPRNENENTKINHVDHGLRFWTLAAKFDDDNHVSGTEMRRLLLDSRRFHELYGDEAKDLLTADARGIRVRVQEGNQSSSHVDHTMACLAEVGTPLDFPVIVGGSREMTFRAIVEQSLRDFSLNQVEYEWSAVTYASFLPPTTRWMTSEGQEMSFDRIAHRIMRERLPRGVCFGNHRLHALVMLLRIDEQTPIIEAETRDAIMAFLLDATQKLVAHQHPDGFWNDQWPDQNPESSTPTDREGDRLPERILATGHALEWWALAPEELHPPRPVLAAAGQWLVRAIDDLTEQQTLDYFTYLSHAGRALSLWRSKSPAEEIQRIAASHADETVDAAPAADGDSADASKDVATEPAHDAEQPAKAAEQDDAPSLDRDISDGDDRQPSDGEETDRRQGADRERGESR